MLDKTKYSCLNKKTYLVNKIKFDSIEINDIEKIRIWRNQQIYHLRQNNLITKKEQLKYFKNNVWNEKNKLKPTKILFSIRYNNNLIGYCGLVHISWANKNAEISFLLKSSIKENSNKFLLLFETYIKFISKIAFSELNLHKIYTECFSTRLKLIEKIKLLGFVNSGYKKDFYFKKGKFISSLIQSLYNTD